VAEDIQATHSNWSRYGDFLAERDALAGKDWLSMRDQVHKIEDFLTKWEGVVSGKGAEGQQDASTAAIAVLLLNEVKIYRWANVGGGTGDACAARISSSDVVYAAAVAWLCGLP
jgi:dynein heavy chain 2